jgi:hypothetical protein
LVNEIFAFCAETSNGTADICTFADNECPH